MRYLRAYRRIKADTRAYYEEASVSVKLRFLRIIIGEQPQIGASFFRRGNIPVQTLYLLTIRRQYAP